MKKPMAKSDKVQFILFLCCAISNTIAHAIVHDEFPDEWGDKELRGLIAELAIKLMTFTREDAARRRDFGTILDRLRVPTAADLEAGIVHSWRIQ